jgi:hypothetical protein
MFNCDFLDVYVNTKTKNLFLTSDHFLEYKHHVYNYITINIFM